MKEILKRIYPQSTEANREKFADALKSAMIRYDIDNVNRCQAFLTQIGVESAQLAATTENLNYSAGGLRSVFGKYFKTYAEAEKYARKPEQIANIVYANRLGNGNTESGDGWRYRGRGLIQLTGKDNYIKATNKMYALPLGVNFESNPDLLLTPEYAAQSAAWFWASNGLNALADELGRVNEAEVFRMITKRINGGYNGSEERIKLYEHIKKVIV